MGSKKWLLAPSFPKWHSHLSSLGPEARALNFLLRFLGLEWLSSSLHGFEGCAPELSLCGTALCSGAMALTAVPGRCC